MNSKFICSWSLPEPIKELGASSDPTTRDVSKTVMDNFGGLVDMVIFSPQGTFVEHLSMNKDILKKGSTDAEKDSRFKKFLKSGY